MSGMGIEVRGLVCSFGKGSERIEALRDIDLDIEPGESVAVMGRSGSGKSTLLHVLGAMLRPTGGEVRAGGRRLESLSAGTAAEHRRKVGFVFQRFHLLPMLSAEDNVALPALPYRAGKRLRTEARLLLDQVGLAGRERALPTQLSGGEQQRVAIARALVVSPELLLADEPTGNLDSGTGEAVLDLLCALHREHGFTMLVATHDQPTASRMQRLVRLADGKIA